MTEREGPQIRLEPISPEEALEREWLCANGRGDYAMGSLAGANTRRYHGLLVAALAPPLGRTVLCAKVDETFDPGSGPIDLGANEFEGGTRHPWGVTRLSSFELDGLRPTWRYAVPGGELRKSVWMQHAHPTTYLRYVAAGTGGRLRLAVFATYRDYHHETKGSPQWQLDVRPVPGGAEVVSFSGATPWRILGPRGARFVPSGQWWWGFFHRRESERGLDSKEDLVLIGFLEFALAPGEPATVLLTTEPGELDSEGAWERQVAREEGLIRQAGAESSPLRARLTLAADQFLVRRGPVPVGQAGTILAGYPWFSDWGRDTMISLPGLTLATGRHAEARAILRNYAGAIDQGMLPNRFPDSGERPEYNTVDATLWYFQAIAAYLAASNDFSLVEELYPALAEILACHLSGTRYGIGVDPEDHLLRAGEEGCQLTWMDAKVGDWVVTPRRGKPVEINALWYNALRHMAAWEERVGRPALRGFGSDLSLAERAEEVRKSFSLRFWNPAGSYLYDVIDTPWGPTDASLRPNQLFAISLPHPVLHPSRFAPVAQAVGRSLLVPVGLRTLAPGSPGYQGRYQGDQWHRDGAYHQGTVWAWLIGAYLDALRRVGTPEMELRALCQPLVHHLADAGIGSISEVFDGDAPHRPDGCPAQAWSVAELLRVLTP